MNNPAFAMSVRLYFGSEGGSLEKFILTFIPHNPLKRLDSDERIQGNPTRKNQGFGGESATSQENPNGWTSIPFTSSILCKAVGWSSR
jgi:hypothetical protein